jgi:hypothetical protein
MPGAVHAGHLLRGKPHRVVRRRWLAAAASAAVVAAGLSVLGLVAGAGRASANPTGASPSLYVTSGDAADTLSLDQVDSGGAPASTISGWPSSAAPIVGPVAISADASRAVVGATLYPGSAQMSGDLVVADVAASSVAGTISLGPGSSTPAGIAMDPTNPSVAYVAEPSGPDVQVDQVDISAMTGPLTVATITFGGLTFTPSSVAISPDGQTVFVGGHLYGPFTAASNAVVAAVSLATSPAQISYCQGSCLWSDTSIEDLAVSPDGQQLFVSGQGNASFFDVPLPFGSGSGWHYPPSPSATGAPAGGPITVSPDGQSVYGSFYNANTGSSTVIGLSAGSGAVEGSPQPIGGYDLTSFSVWPVGSAAATMTTVGTTPNNTTVLYPLRLTPAPQPPGTSSPLPFSFGAANAVQGIAITPDQAPVARFTASTVNVGSPTIFDAGSSNKHLSSVAYGTITTFHWFFGDGPSATVTTGSPTVTYTYSSPGTYRVTLIETDSAGTSIPPATPAFGAVDGPGQTAYRRASQSATTEGAATVLPPGATVPPTVPPPKAANPTLTLNPAVGPPGTIVTVTGSGFPPNTPITIAWSVSSGSITVTTDGNGNLPSSQLLILVPDVLGPRFAVSATSPPAQAPFLVVPGPAEPGGTGGSYLFRTEGP